MRPTARDRGYGREWRTGLRARQLKREARCQYVTTAGERCMHPATDVDHIVPKARGGPDDLTNLQSLCHRHHSMKTARENPQTARSHRRPGLPDVLDYMRDSEDDERPARAGVRARRRR